jgi:uncharacterized protein
MNEFKPHFWHFNPHLQTIIPSVFRKVKNINYQRERISTPDGDFLDIDWSSGKTNSNLLSKKIVLISHGLEGNSTRQYILGMVKIFNNNGYDTLSWNFRSCSGQINDKLRFYHSGATDDLQTVIQHVQNKGYAEIFLVGFSLGGNIVLKYLGEIGPIQIIKKAIVFSVPMDLATSSDKIAQKSNWIYTYRFLKSLKAKIIKKAKFYPNEINLANLGKIKTLESFDNEYTSKLHGFINAKDYYAKNSSIIFVEKIAIPTLIVNAKNDPFLSKECFPIDLLKNHPFVTLEIPEKGGHCGFWQKDYKDQLWSEIIALKHISN